MDAFGDTRPNPRYARSGGCQHLGDAENDHYAHGGPKTAVHQYPYAVVLSRYAGLLDLLFPQWPSGLLDGI